MDKKKIFIIIGIFWLVIIGGFIAFKEFTLQTGNEVLLKTRPVDPRDLFRGDYVILRYDISTVFTNEFSKNSSNFEKEDNIYVSLNVDDEKIGTIKNIYKNTPDDEMFFIKGIVKNVYGDRLNVEYGIESYFVPEGEGRVIEREMGKIYTKVAIDNFGNAVIKSLVLDGEEIEL